MAETSKCEDDVNPQLSDVCRQLFPAIPDENLNMIVRKCFRMLQKESDKYLYGGVTLQDQPTLETNGFKGRKIDESVLITPRSNMQETCNSVAIIPDLPGQFNQAGPSETVSVESLPSTSSAPYCQPVEHEELCEYFKEKPKAQMKMLDEKVQKLNLDADSTSVERRLPLRYDQKPIMLLSEFKGNVEEPQDFPRKEETNERKPTEDCQQVKHQVFSEFVKEDEKLEKWRKPFETLNKQSDFEDCNEELASSERQLRPFYNKKPTPESQLPGHQYKPCRASCSLASLFWLFPKMGRLVCLNKFIDCLSRCHKHAGSVRKDGGVVQCKKWFRILERRRIIKVVGAVDVDVSTDNFYKSLLTKVGLAKGSNLTFFGLLVLSYEGAAIGHCVALVCKNNQDLQIYDAQKEQSWPDCDDRIHQVKKMELYEIDEATLEEKDMRAFRQESCDAELVSGSAIIDSSEL